MLVQAAKLIGAGMAAVSMSGTGAGIGILFGAFLISMSRNPSEQRNLFVYTILGFALTEAIALFGLMITFLLLFGF